MADALAGRGLKLSRNDKNKGRRRGVPQGPFETPYHRLFRSLLEHAH